MKGLAKLARGEGHMDIIDIPEPTPPAGWVKMEIKVAGICGSDLHIYHDDIDFIMNPPCVAGHEFSVANIIRGETIGYCKDAVLYDEQPVNFRQSCRQRMRWAKGYLQVFRKYGLQLFAGIFGKNGFSCFDMCMNIMPAMILSIFSVVFNVTALILTLIQGTGLGIATFSVIQSLVNGSLLILVLGFITTLTQWKHIHTTTGKKLLYTLTFPIFMFTYLPITAVALFRKVEWKPISHNVRVSVDDISSVALPMSKKASAFKLRAK